MSAVSSPADAGSHSKGERGDHRAPAGFNSGGIVFRIVSVVGVSAYLFVVFIYLLARKRLHPPCSIKKLIRAQFRSRYSAQLNQISSEIGSCYTAAMPEELISDFDGASRIKVFEDGKALPHGKAMHDEIRNLGGGRFSHWGPHLFFSTSDNSDPRTNGRVYTAAEV